MFPETLKVSAQNLCAGALPKGNLLVDKVSQRWERGLPRPH